MAKLRPGSLGYISGKVGNVVVSSWKGIGIVKGLPKPPSGETHENLVSQRDRFSKATKFLKAIKQIIFVAYRKFGAQETGYSSALRSVITSFNGIYPTHTLDYSKIIVATERFFGNSANKY